MSLSPAWSSKEVSDSLGYLERPCLKRKKKDTPVGQERDRGHLDTWRGEAGSTDPLLLLARNGPSEDSAVLQ